MIPYFPSTLVLKLIIVPITETKKRGRPRKDQSTIGYQGTIRVPKAKAAKPLRVVGSLTTSASHSENSSSEEESSSEDESDYEEEVKLPPVDISTVSIGIIISFDKFSPMYLYESVLGLY